MLDPTKPVAPAWRKYLILAVMPILIGVCAYVIWSRELHHSKSAGPSSTPPVTSAPAQRLATNLTSPPTTVPGGLPISARNPFAS
jgi:hypothetical protein